MQKDYSKEDRILAILDKELKHQFGLGRFFSLIAAFLIIAIGSFFLFQNMTY